jgi:ATP-dependent DNA helicase RecG
MDLEQRGPGDFFGSRQHGLPDFAMASLTDMKGLDEAGKMVEFYLAVREAIPEKESSSVDSAVQRLFGTVAMN